MIIKKAKYKNIMVKQRKCISQEVHGCDECKTIINRHSEEESSLEMTIFRNNNEQAEHLHFCSWDCVLRYIPQAKTDYFIALPYLKFDDKKGSKSGSERLIKLLDGLALDKTKMK